MFSVLIASYETMRAHVGRLLKYRDCCDLLVCDEAHRLKNKDNQTSRALFSLPCRRRVLLTGTPMQNDLQEFFAMVDFINPGVLGTQEGFRREYMFPILRGREPTSAASTPSTQSTSPLSWCRLCAATSLASSRTCTSTSSAPRTCSTSWTGSRSTASAPSRCS